VPLYLHNAHVKRLDIDRSTRLCITLDNQTKRFIPAHHVSRIVCNNNIDISASALIACMELGIPVAVVSAKGEPIGWCLGARRKETTLAQLLLNALEDATWTQLYQHWQTLQTSAAAANALLLCQVACTPAAMQNPRAALCNAQRVKHGIACAKQLKALSLLAHSAMSAQLAQETNATQLLAWYRPGLNLLTDLGDILALNAHIDLHHASTLPNDDQLDKWATRYFEKHAAHWQQRIGQLHFAFEQFLREHWL